LAKDGVHDMMHKYSHDSLSKAHDLITTGKATTKQVAKDMGVTPVALRKVLQRHGYKLKEKTK